MTSSNPPPALPDQGPPSHSASDPPRLNMRRRPFASWPAMLVLIILGGVVGIVMHRQTNEALDKEAAEELSVGTSDQIDLFISRFGRPDMMGSTEADSPRPPIVTKWLIYTSAQVRVFFQPDSKAGDPPPYKGWRLFAVLKEDDRKSLTFEEAVARLESSLTPGKRPL